MKSPTGLLSHHKIKSLLILQSGVTLIGLETCELIEEEDILNPKTSRQVELQSLAVVQQSQ
jgi:hypothetical protein